jgi:uncharacterized protein HemY
MACRGTALLLLKALLTYYRKYGTYYRIMSLTNFICCLINYLLYINYLTWAVISVCVTENDTNVYAGRKRQTGRVLIILGPGQVLSTLSVPHEMYRENGFHL